MSNVSKSSSGKINLSGNDRLTVEQRREVKRSVESARDFQHNRRIKAHRVEVLNQIARESFSSSARYNPAQSISAKSHQMADKLKRYCA
jgi:hypothetical protein